MKATVSTLYRNGVRRPFNKVNETVTGDLNLAVSNHPVTRRCDICACVLADTGASLIKDLHNAVCVSIAAHGLMLVGTESVNGKEYAQEWWCRPVVTDVKP